MCKDDLLRASRLSLFFLTPVLVACSSGGAPVDPDADMQPDLAVTRPDLGDGGSVNPPDQKATPALLWVKQLAASTNEDSVKAIAVDAAGNVYAACQFSDQTDFGDGPRKTRGNHDVALVKLTAAGEFVWLRQFGDTDADTVERVAVDSSGNVIVSGSFNGSVDFGGGVVTSRGRADFYVAKYASDGRFLWAKGLGTDQSELGYQGLAVDAAGSVYFTATWGGSAASSSIDLGGGPLTTNGYADGFLVKYDPSGAHVFSKRFGGPYHDRLMTMALDPNGEILIGGQLSGTVDLGGGPMVPGSPITDWAFIARLSSSGAYKSAVGYYATGSSVTALAVDSSSTVTVAGQYLGMLQTRTTSLSSGDSAQHGFLLQLDGNGTEKWARSLVSGSTSDRPVVLSLGGGLLYVGGEFRGSGNFGPAKLTALETDGFIAGYSMAGAPQWVRQYGGEGIDTVFALVRTPDAIYASGYFAKTTDFGGTQLTSKGFGDGFVLKLPPNP